jgi:hypothetical protein
MKQLLTAYPDVSRQGLTRDFSHPAGEGESQLVFEAIKCPGKYMESSIAVVLEHTEHITMGIKRDEEVVLPDVSSPVPET